jgi:hypothetical protein
VRCTGGQSAECDVLQQSNLRIRMPQHLGHRIGMLAHLSSGPRFLPIDVRRAVTG